MDQRLALRVEEAARSVGIGRSKAYGMVASGEWPAIRIGRCVRVPVAGLRAWLEAQVQAQDDTGSRDQGVERPQAVVAGVSRVE